MAIDEGGVLGAEETERIAMSRKDRTYTVH